MQHELVLRAQSGDHDAFTALARASIPRLYANARFIVRDPDLAQDAVQDALFKAWRDIRGLRDPDRLDAWLHRILVRTCYDIAGRERRRQVKEIAFGPFQEPAGPEGLRPLADRDEIERAFRHLTLDQRAVLTLVYLADMTVADASVVLGIPLGTTKSRLHHALNALRSALEADERVTQMMGGQPA